MNFLKEQEKIKLKVKSKENYFYPEPKRLDQMQRLINNSLNHFFH